MKKISKKYFEEDKDLYECAVRSAVCPQVAGAVAGV